MLTLVPAGVPVFLQFNRIAPDVYRQFRKILCGDFTSFHMAKVLLALSFWTVSLVVSSFIRCRVSQHGRDYSLSVSRRFGFASFPLGVLVRTDRLAACSRCSSQSHASVTGGACCVVCV